MGELWRPTAEQASATQLAAFARRVAGRLGRAIGDYEDLYAWSIRAPEAFWAELWDFARVRARRTYRRVLDDPERLPGARWFEGAELNFAENLLWATGPEPALIFEGEAGDERVLSRDALRSEVARVAEGLRELGIGRGDRVAGVLPNLPETVVAMLASASLGAIWTSCSPDFGAPAVLDRLGQTRPKLLFAADGYRYAGRAFDTGALVRELAERLPGGPRVVAVSYLHAGAPLPGALPYAQLGPRVERAELRFEPLPFDHPLYILYSSGTTGVPKCIVHGAGGTLVQHLKEHLLHTDVHPGDRVFYFTTCGWMMWNWLVSALAAGAALVLYDGSPLHPDPQRLFSLAQRHQLSHFGTSPRFLAAVERAGAGGIELPALRTVLSTGAPLSAAGFRAAYRAFGPDLRLSSISGGTDIVGCFFAGNPIGPVRAGELQCRALGMRVEAWNERGDPVVGAKGELVCTAAFPSVPLGFWNDPGDVRFRRAYFERFAGVWTHGDFVELRPGGGAVVHGRSDATLNPGGVRIGTAEIYRVLEGIEAVEDALAVDWEAEGGTRILLFVQTREGVSLAGALRERIRAELRARASPRHVPARIHRVSAIPYTRSGKKVELAVREAIHGRPVAGAEALVNPEVLAEFRQCVAQQGDWAMKPDTEAVHFALDHAMIDDAQARRAQQYADHFGEPGYGDPEAVFIDQRYEGYTQENQETWRILCDRQQEYVNEWASDVYLRGARAIQLRRDRIPKLQDVSERLAPLTGWCSRPVPGYLPAQAFFACCAVRRFPTTIVIRPRNHLGYLPQPDIFHDVFGHVPLHADPVFAEFLQAYGRTALRTRDPEQLERMTRLFWFTVEFGLIHEGGRTKLYGSGLISSPEEARHAIESDEVERLPFDLDRVCSTSFEIDRFQPLLFVLEDFTQLRDAMLGYEKQFA